MADSLERAVITRTLPYRARTAVEHGGPDFPNYSYLKIIGAEMSSALPGRPARVTTVSEHLPHGLIQATETIKFILGTVPEVSPATLAASGALRAVRQTFLETVPCLHLVGEQALAALPPEVRKVQATHMLHMMRRPDTVVDIRVFPGSAEHAPPGNEELVHRQGWNKPAVHIERHALVLGAAGVLHEVYLTGQEFVDPVSSKTEGMGEQLAGLEAEASGPEFAQEWLMKMAGLT